MNKCAYCGITPSSDRTCPGCGAPRRYEHVVHLDCDIMGGIGVYGEMMQSVLGITGIDLLCSAERKNVRAPR